MKFEGLPKEQTKTLGAVSVEYAIDMQEIPTERHCDACRILIGDDHIYKDLKSLKYNNKEWHLDPECYNHYKENLKLLSQIKDHYDR